MRCTDASAAAFGVTTVEAHDAIVVAQTIKEQIGRGYDHEPIVSDDDKHYGKDPTLARVIRERPTGDFLIITAGHCMALRDGKLTDTELGGCRRRVLGALRINP